MLKVWYGDSKIEINENTVFFVGKVGSGNSVFGEHAKFKKELKNHLVFETESGVIVKTEKDTLNTVGKAEKNRYFVSIGKRENFIHYPVSYDI